MTLRFCLVNLFFLGLAHWLFFWIAHPTQDNVWLQLALHVAFGVGAGLYLLYADFFLRRRASPLRYLTHLSIASGIFYLTWTVGIAIASNFADWMQRSSKVRELLYTNTSGQQFSSYHDTFSFFVIFFMVIFILNLCANMILKKWLISNPVN